MCILYVQACPAAVLLFDGPRKIFPSGRAGRGLLFVRYRYIFLMDRYVSYPPDIRTMGTKQNRPAKSYSEIVKKLDNPKPFML